MKKAYIVAFWLIIVLPFIGMAFYKTDMSVEKRTGALFPSVKTSEGKLNTHYFDELNDYFNDYFAFRQELATVDEFVLTGLTKTSGNDQVIVGKDGWLFFSETMDEYLGENLLSDRDINNAARTISILENYCEANNIKFVFAVAPVKAELYPEFMPYNYVRQSTVNNRTRLDDALAVNKINTVNLYDLFAKDDRKLYHKLDTHWNNQGASIAMEYLLNAVDKNHSSYKTEKYNITKDFDGDLYGMLYPKGNKKDNNVTYEKKHKFKYLGDNVSVEDNKITANCNSADGSLVMYRDSYGNALIPFMADEFKDSYYTKIVPFNFDEVKKHEADTVVILITQRHISYLTKYAPVMAATFSEELPEIIDVCEKKADVVVNHTDAQDKIKISGHLDKTLTDVDSPVYIRVTDSQYVTDYEAFPIGVNSDKSLNDDYQFTVYLKKSNIVEGENNIEVVTKKDGKYVSTGLVYSFDYN